jgi:3-oxoisoapionate decarboxylase
VLLGISSYTYTWAIGVRGHPPDRPMSACDLLERAAGLGVAVVQIADNLPLHEMPGSELDALEGHARALGLVLELGTRGIEPDHLRTYLRLAEQLHSPLVRVVVDTTRHHPSPSEVTNALSQVVAEFQRAGVLLALENHDRFKARTLVDIIRSTGSANVGICLDTVNSFGALEGPEAVLDALGPLTVNVHIKDFAVVRASHQMGFVIEGRPAGTGQLDVSCLLRRLRELGRDPNLILELWTPPESTTAETIAREGAWAVQSIANLRSYAG